MLFLALIFFVGLTINAKTCMDRWIYGALAGATLGGLIYYREIPALTAWLF